MDFSDIDPEKDEVFISGLPMDVTEEQLAEYFGQIGIIKEDKKRRGKPKIWLYRDKATGEFKGEATVTYEDAFAAASAPSWFNDKEWNGHVLKVSLSDRKAKAAADYAASRGGGGGGGGGGGYSRGGGGGGGYEDRGGGGGGGRGPSRPGDWTCPTCNNNCFARRDTCNRCGTPKSAAGGGGGGGGGGYEDRGGGGGGRGGGRPGDWACPGCGNNCFAFRDSCNRCGAAKPGGGGGGGGGDGGHRRDRSRSPRRDYRDSRDRGGDRYRDDRRGGGGGDRGGGDRYDRRDRDRY